MSEDVRIRVSVARVNGACRLHYKQGDEFLLQGTTTPSYFFCGAAYYILYPALLALANGASFSFRENPNTATTRCPDDGKIEFLIERLGRCGGAR